MEALLYAAQEQPIRKNCIKHNVGNIVHNLLCRICGKKGKTAQHMVTEREKSKQCE